MADNTETISIDVPGVGPVGFPRTMSTPEIEAAIRKIIGGAGTADNTQLTGPMRIPAMAGSALAKGALTGAGIVGDIQGGVQSLVNRVHDPIMGELVNPLANALISPLTDYRLPTRSPPESRDYGSALPAGGEPVRDLGDPLLSSSNLVAGGRAAGVVDRPDLIPRTAGERYLTAGAEAAGGTLPYLPISGPSTLASGLRSVVQGTGAGLGGQAGSEIGGPIGGVLGTVAGLYGGGKTFDAGNRVLGLGAVPGQTTPTIDAYRRLQIDPTLAGDVSGSTFWQRLQQGARNAPGGAGRVQAAGEKAVAQWGEALDNTAHGYGNARTAQQAGEQLQLEGAAWLRRFRADSNAAWNEVDMHVPGRTPVALNDTMSTMGQIRTSMPSLPETAKAVESPFIGNLYEKLQADLAKGTATWNDLRALRTRIGERLADPQLIADTGRADMQRLYAALSRDMEAVVAQRGQAAVDAFSNASALTRNGHAFVDDVLTRIQGPGISPERAATSIVESGGQGGTILEAVRREMPRAADELAAFKLRDMALATGGKQTAAQSAVSPETFLTDRFKLAPEAQDILFGHDPHLARRVEDLATVADAMRSTTRALSNPSGTAGMSLALGAIASPLAAYHGFQQGGPEGGVAGLLSPWLPGYLAARAVTSPRITGAISRTPTAVSGTLPATAGALSATPLGNEVGQIPFREKAEEALRALQRKLGL
jgi:hypothetical protein